MIAGCGDDGRQSRGSCPVTGDRGGPCGFVVETQDVASLQDGPLGGPGPGRKTKPISWGEGQRGRGTKAPTGLGAAGAGGKNEANLAGGGARQEAGGTAG